MAKARRSSMKPLVNFGMALILTAIALPAQAEQWSKTYTISGKPDLRVETSDANIHVDTWDQKTIEARVISQRYKIGEGGLRIDEHQSGNSVELYLHFPNDIHVFTFNVHSYRVDIEI